MGDGPPRGGTRGGADQFKWDAVKNDKFRECYLGHSVKASTGRWQKGKDIYWYNKKGTLGLDEDIETLKLERDEVKRQEEAMMRQALGLEPREAADRSELEPSEVGRLLRGGGDGEDAADGGAGVGARAGGSGGPARDAYGGVSFEGGERTLADVWRTGPAAGGSAAPLGAGAQPTASAALAPPAGSSGSSSSSNGSDSGERKPKRKSRGDEAGAGKRKHKHKHSRSHGGRKHESRDDEAGAGKRKHSNKHSKKHKSDKRHRD
ncbi:kinase phosphorylation protein-domain-containing protein [Pavlovales sp. CCMP2436]|nr:kinase phosphorylation protein-domain-containing protein [Pavlovales sp. CCMP2436]|mmetsp:Transcript_24839/g.62872  ORF Transcript_24839/g.62872 Transcript_24839/m.62872 type:complete len:263 (-) Transcript_24839:179-967(-)